MKLYTANEIIVILKEGSWQYVAIKEWMNRQIELGASGNLSVPAFRPMIDCIKY